MKKILLLDDDERLLKTLTLDFTDHGYQTYSNLSAKETDFSICYDYAVLDLRLSYGDLGLDLIPKIIERSPTCRVVVLTGYGGINSAVEAIKRGAIDFIAKPASFKDIEQSLLGKKYDPTVDFKPKSLAQVEGDHIDFVLNKNDGNITKAAKDLGLHRQSLQRKLKKYF